MRPVKALPAKFGRLIRFKCTCGHCEDLKDDCPSPQGHGRQVPVLEGFEELPSVWTPVAVRGNSTRARRDCPPGVCKNRLQATKNPMRFKGNEWSSRITR